VPDLISKDIRNKFGKGMIKINANLGKTKWQTSLFPYKNPKGEFGYLLAIKKNIRKIEEVYENDRISLAFKVI